MSNRKSMSGTFLLRKGDHSPPPPPPRNSYGGPTPRRSTTAGPTDPGRGRPTRDGHVTDPDDSQQDSRLSEVMRSDKQESTAVRPAQEFNFFLVVDFQATCEVHTRPQPEPREIIEISVAKVDSKTFEVDSLFHQYVCPRVNKKLTKFCTQLTGISQSMVDGEPALDTVLKKFHAWLQEQNLFKPGVSFATVSHSDWAMRTLLPRNIGANSKSGLPEYFKKWIDILKTFEAQTGLDPTDELDSLQLMLKTFQLKLDGPRHSGIFVCHNIVQILRALATHKQTVFRVNAQR